MDKSVVDKADQDEIEGQENEEEEDTSEMYPLPSSRNNFDDYAIKPSNSLLKNYFATTLFTLTGLFTAFNPLW